MSRSGTAEARRSNTELIEERALAARGARQGSFWAELDKPGRRKLLAQGWQRWYEGEYDLIYRQGRTDSHAVVLLAGHAKVTVDKSARQETLLALRFPGQILGDDQALQQSGTTVRTVTVQPLNWALGLVIDSDVLQRFLDRHPRAWPALATDLRSRLAEAENRLGEMAAEGANRRLARGLASLIDHDMAMRTGTSKTTLSLTQRELASWIGVSTETVERTLRTWRTRSIIATGYRSITVLQPDTLLRIAGVKSSFRASQPFLEIAQPVQGQRS